MNLILKLTAISLLIISCKGEAQNKQEKQFKDLEKKETKVDSVTNFQTTDGVKTLYTSYIDIKENKTEKITAVVKALQANFKSYSFNKDLNELRDFKKKKEFSKSKGFLKTLSRDLKNTNFLNVSSIHYSCIEPRNEQYPSRITIEEWYFEDEQKAKSCFESLQKYEEFTIYFKSINWIWIHQNHKIFLVFALDHLVTGSEMQYIKQELINVIKPSGTYETVQFYE